MDLKMKSKTFGWSSEMIVKAAKKKMRIFEVTIKHQKRIGKSKISGSITKSILAALHIIYSIFRYL
jgi:hypothetical protein